MDARSKFKLTNAIRRNNSVGNVACFTHNESLKESHCFKLVTLGQRVCFCIKYRLIRMHARAHTPTYICTWGLKKDFSQDSWRAMGSLELYIQL